MMGKISQAPHPKILILFTAYLIQKVQSGNYSSRALYMQNNDHLFLHDPKP